LTIKHSILLRGPRRSRSRNLVYHTLLCGR